MINNYEVLSRENTPFLEDIAANDAMSVVTIRSPSGRSRMTLLALPPLPRGYISVTPKDISGINQLEAFGVTMPILAEDEIMYRGEPVALLAGPDPRVLEELKKNTIITVEKYPDKPAFPDFDESQVLSRRETVRGDCELAFSLSKNISESSFFSGSQEHWYSEPQGAIACFEYDKLVIFSSTQWPYHVRRTVSKALGIKDEDVIVRPTACGVHLDGKLWYPSLVAAHAALCAVKVRADTRLILERNEDFYVTTKRAPASVIRRVAQDENGQITGLDMEARVDMGAYGPLSEEILDRVCLGALGVYSTSNIRIRGVAITTDAPPFGAFAGLGLSQGFFPAETQMSDISKKSGMDPLDFRLLHLPGKNQPMPTGEIPKNTPPLRELVIAASNVSDFRRKHAAYELLKVRRSDLRDNPLRGIGLSCAYQGNGFLGKREEKENYSCEVELNKDLILTIRTSAVLSNAEGLAMLKAIAGSVLSIPLETIRIESNATNRSPDSGPSILSRNMTVLTQLIEKCCLAIQKKRFRDPLPIIERKHLTFPKSAKWSGSTLTGTPFKDMSWGACICEVEVDPVLFSCQVRGIWLSIDAGRIISIPRAKSSLEASTIAALSWSSRERINPGKDGPDDFFVYEPMPIEEVPNIAIQFMGNTETAPVKGLGDLPFHLIPSAYVQAVNQAVGTTFSSIPLILDKGSGEKL